MKNKTNEARSWLWSSLFLKFLKAHISFWSHEGKLSHIERKRRHVLWRNNPQTDKALMHTAFHRQVKASADILGLPVCVLAGPGQPLVSVQECFLSLNLEEICHVREIS